MKRKAVINIFNYGVKAGISIINPGIGILIGLRELIKLSKYIKKRRGDWKGEEDEKKMLALKMMTASPTAFLSLLGKALKEKGISSTPITALSSGISGIDDLDEIVEAANNLNVEDLEEIKNKIKSK